MQVGARTVEFTPGTIVCQPPLTPHSGRSEQGYQDMWLHVSGFVPPRDGEILVFQDDSAQRFRTVLEMMYESFLQHEPCREQLVAALWEVLYQLMLGWSMAESRSTAVSRLIHEMIRHVSDADWSLADSIALSGYSADHIRRCFKRETGLPPTAYFMRMRIEHAQRLLALSSHGGYTVKQIGLMSGFHDPYYFSRAFKKITGCSPNEYTGSRQVD